MLKPELEARVQELQKAIDQTAANLNALIGRRDELIYVMSEMDKFQEKCAADNAQCAAKQEGASADDQRAAELHEALQA